jgi:hypothetical protein
VVLSDALGSGALGPVELCLTQIGAAQAICRAFSQVRCGIERLPCARPIGHGREVALANVLDLPAESVIAASFAGGANRHILAAPPHRLVYGPPSRRHLASRATHEGITRAA